LGFIEDTDVEAELSYALLHAVAAKARATCVCAERLSDARGIDATLTSWGPFGAGDRQEVDLKIQLKATTKPPADLGTHFSYSISKVAQYDQLRAVNVYSVPRILVVLFLPPSSAEWLSATAEELLLRRAAYWVSLSGAPPVATKSATVYLPKTQLLTPHSLQALMSELASGNYPSYDIPGALA